MLNNYSGTIYNNILITNILKKIYFTDNFIKSNLIENYFIEDEDTPEAISTILYGKPSYSWFILILNNIQNLHESWPIPQNVLLEYSKNKYSTSSIIINPLNLIQNNINLSNIKYIGNNDVFFEIKNYNKTFSKLITKTKINFSLNPLFASSLGLYDNNNNLLTTLYSGYRIVYDDLFSIKYFKKNNDIVDPFSEVYLSGPSYIESYSNGESEEYVFTNYNYELEINDEKRNILLIRPEYIDQVYRQYRKIMKGINKSKNILDVSDNNISSLLE
jgi:hypothetical protein